MSAAVLLTVLSTVLAHAQMLDFFFYELAKTGTPQAIQAAIDEGANIHAQTKEGGTALMTAARYNQNAMVIDILLKAGADINARTIDGWTALMLAAQFSQNPDVIVSLSKAGADANAQDKDGWTALIVAAANNRNSAVVRTLLRAGVNIKAKTKNGGTALIAAAANGQSVDVMEIWSIVVDEKVRVLPPIIRFRGVLRYQLLRDRLL